MRRCCIAGVVALLLWPSPAAAEIAKVTIASKTTVANGQSFGAVGPYEKLVGTIEFALDPAERQNARIVDLQYAPRAADGKVHFTSSLYVLRPVDAARGNGVLLFEIANRGRKGLIGRFNRGPAITDPGSNNPEAPAHFGDGFLMRDGYTLVWVGWEFDALPPLLGMEAPPVTFPPGLAVAPLRVEILVNGKVDQAQLIDDPNGRAATPYPPLDPNSSSDSLTVRDGFWDRPVPIGRERWRFVTGAGAPAAIRLDGGFEPGRTYEITYRATGAVVAGAGMAAIRDAASAFRYRSDMPVRGRSAYVYGASQSGRFLREFLHDGFNADEQGRKVFDAVWAHIAGAARGPFIERFVTPTTITRFTATRFPFLDASSKDTDGTSDGLQAVYTPELRPKVFYSNTSVEYWGVGRGAALTHSTLDGMKDAEIPGNVRIYHLAGTQHGEAAFPPTASTGAQVNNPTPQADVMRALLRGLHGWVSSNTPPPANRYPRLADASLVAVQRVRFPRIPGVGDPRTITGPARTINGSIVRLPFLVPQVDADGNEIGGIRVPDQQVPLATVTGWNFRSREVGSPADIYQLLGSYVPFAATRVERESRGDSRRSVEERYRSRQDYLARIRSAAADLIKGGYLLQQDMDSVLSRANAHWDLATRPRTNTTLR